MPKSSLLLLAIFLVFTGCAGSKKPEASVEASDAKSPVEAQVEKMPTDNAMALLKDAEKALGEIAGESDKEKAVEKFKEMVAKIEALANIMEEKASLEEAVMSKSDLKKMESRLELIVAMTDIITDYDMPEQFEERLEEASDKLEEAMEKIGDAMEIMEEKAKVMKKALNTSKEDPTEKLAPIFKSMEKISDEMMRESDREKIMKKITEVVEKLEEMADVMENSDASKLDADKMEEQLDEIMRKIAIKAMGIANEAREEAKEESASKLAFNMLMIGLRIEDAWERIEEAIEGD